VARELFVDASAWYPLAVRTHPDHKPLAAALTDRVTRGVRVVTTNLVVAESHALLLNRVGRDPAYRFLTTVRAIPNIVVSSTMELEERAIVAWVERYADQSFTLADAVSFTVMSDRRIREALTLDRHFATAGFVMVPDA
jgi:predicted nucleic acid-binding protein